VASTCRVAIAYPSFNCEAIPAAKQDKVRDATLVAAKHRWASFNLAQYVEKLSAVTSDVRRMTAIC